VVSQKVPRDRTAVESLDARPTTTLDVRPVAPVIVPDLVDDTAEPGDERPDADAATSAERDIPPAAGGPDESPRPSLNEIARRMRAPTAVQTGDGPGPVVEPVGGPDL